MIAVADAAARRDALDVRRSFIVQAPAGAGKTELLIQRLLALLGTVEHPSRILAITFTHKAAGEMRERLQAALTDAAVRPEPDASPARDRWRLARRVVERDRERGWGLLNGVETPAIETFDAFCLRLARAGWAPEAGDGTAWASLDEDLRETYREAARAAIEADDEIGPSEAEIGELLDRMDNRVGTLIEGMADLLARRGQWAHHALDDSDDATQTQEALLVARVEARLAALARHWTASELQSAQEWAAVASAHLADESERAALAPLAERSLDALPCPCLEDVPAWRALARLMLTRDGLWRSQVSATQGFPPSVRTARDALKAFCAARRARDVSGREAALLAAALRWPDRGAFDDQARARRLTQRLLRRALVELQLRLAGRGVTDFAGVALAAEAALAGNARRVAERMDGRIEHILVDEFQDTSPAQARLLARLVAEWSPGDGRTLFVVGDPMQSIYAFRDADVGIFLSAMRDGIGPIPLEVLRLSSNFRARPALVAWVNQTAPAAFARVAEEAHADDVPVVPFAPAEAARAGVPEAAVSLHVFDGVEEEARWIADEICRRRLDRPHERVAVIVRRRQDAMAVISAFAERALGTCAVDFAPLASRPIVRELLALAELLAQPADRLALVAWLRSPLVGLSLRTLAAVAGAPGVLFDLAARQTLLARLDAAEADRLAQALALFDQACAERSLRPLSECVWRLFLRAGGRGLLGTPAEREEADLVLGLIDRAAPRGLLADRSALHGELARLRRTLTAHDGASPAVDVITMHKAKGLEWDTVFLPGLDRAGGRDEVQPLVWLIDRGLDRGAVGRLIVASREARRTSPGSVHAFVRQLRQALQAGERARLLYVAMTRARERLYLTRAFATVRRDTLAALLPWDTATRRAPVAAEPPTPPPETSGGPLVRRSLPRLANPDRRVATAVPPRPADPEHWPAPTGATDAASEAPLERAIGRIGHRLLEALARAGRAGPEPGGADGLDVDAVAGGLLREGVPVEATGPLATRLVEHLRHLAQHSPHWQFLFSDDHAASGSELNLIHDGRLLRVDRTFVTATGERWIVDFKFGAPPAGADEAEWLAAALPRHRAQLTRYARAFAAVEPRAVRCAVYVVWLDQLILISTD